MYGQKVRDLLKDASGGRHPPTRPPRLALPANINAVFKHKYPQRLDYVFYASKANNFPVRKSDGRSVLSSSSPHRDAGWKNGPGNNERDRRGAKQKEGEDNSAGERGESGSASAGRSESGFRNYWAMSCAVLQPKVTSVAPFAMPSTSSLPFTHLSDHFGIVTEFVYFDPKREKGGGEEEAQRSSGDLSHAQR